MKNRIKKMEARENLHSQRRLSLCHKFLAILIACCFTPTYGVVPLNPADATVINGTVAMQTLPGNILKITNSPNAIINWQSFSLPTGHTVQFVQQSASSSVLNRVTAANNPSVIMGAIQSGIMQGSTYVPGLGTVYLINPNGIMFGGNAQVNVGGFVASTLNITDDNFKLGKNIFNSSGTAGALLLDDKGGNKPTITASNPNGGLIYLIAPNVQNEGILTAPNGQIVLAAGHSVMLASSGDPNIHVVISAPSENAVNLGNIIAESGRIGIYGAMLNLTNGIVQANKAVMGPNGTIVLKAVQDLDLGSNVSAQNGTLTLKSDTGNITQTAAVNVANLAAEATLGNVTLTNANNIASTIAGKAGGSGGFQYTSAGNVNVGTVSEYAGISAINGNVILNSTNGNISQSAAINAVNLSANATLGNVILTNANNSANTLAGRASGGFQYTSAGNVNVGTVNGLPGINSNGQIVLTSTGGSITTSDATITGPASDTLLTGSSLILNAFNGIGSQTNPLSTSVNSITAINNGGGNIAIANVGKPLTMGNTQNNGGSIFIDATNSPLTVTGDIQANSGDIGLKTVGNIVINGQIMASGMNSTVALKSFGGSITQSETAAPISASKLSAVAAANVSLQAENDVGTVAGSAGGTEGFSFKNKGNYRIDSVPLVGPDYSNGFFLPAVNGINAANSSISLTSTNGSIWQGSGGNITTTGTLFLNAANNVGASTSDPLLTNVGSLDVSNANNVYIYNHNIGELQLLEVLANDRVNIATTGSLTIPTGDNLPHFTGSEMTLIAGGNLLINTGNTLSANGGNGPINLYAGYTPNLSSDPISNGSHSTITTLLPSGALQGNPVTLYSNGFTNFVGTYTPLGNTSATYIYPPVQLSVVSKAGQQITVIPKVYDDTLSALLTGGELVGVPDGINVTLNQTGLYATKNAGSGIPVMATYGVSSVPFLFTLKQPGGTFTGTISPAPLYIVGQNAANKVYDSTAAAIITGGSLSGLLQQGIVVLNAAKSGSFVSKNVGNNILVSAGSNMISGPDAANYTLMPTVLTANITPATLTISGLTALNKVYNGNNLAQLSSATLKGVLGQDTVTLISPTNGFFNTINVGNGIPVSLAGPYSLAGADAGNYILTQPAGLFANITPPPSQSIILPKPTFINNLNQNSILNTGDKNEIDNSISCS